MIDVCVVVVVDVGVLCVIGLYQYEVIVYWCIEVDVIVMQCYVFGSVGIEGVVII